MSAATKAVGTGPGAWFSHLGTSLAAMPRGYAAALKQRRARTIILTIIIVVGLLYPLIDQLYLADFSRNVFPLPLPDDTVMTFMTIFAIMAVGLNIVVGFAGLLDLGYVAFYAIGAYVAAFLASPHWSALGINLTFIGHVGPGAQGVHIPFWFILVIAVIVVATFGALLGAPTLRLRGDYLAIVTLGFGEIVPLVFKNLSSMTVSLSWDRSSSLLNNVNLTGGVQGSTRSIHPFLPILNILFDSRPGRWPSISGSSCWRSPSSSRATSSISRIGRSWMAHPRGRDGRPDDGRQHGPDEAAGLRTGCQLRRRRGCVPGLVPRRDDVRLLQRSRPRSSSSS